MGELRKPLIPSKTNNMANQKPQVENPDKKLNHLLYAIWDRVFMHYGSTMNSLQHIMTIDNWE